MDQLTNDVYVTEQLVPQMLKALFDRFDFSNVTKDWIQLKDGCHLIIRSDNHGCGTGCASTHYDYIYDGINQPTVRITFCRNPKGDRWLGTFEVSLYLLDRMLYVSYGYMGRDRSGKDVWGWSINRINCQQFEYTYHAASEGPLMDVVIEFVKKIDEAFEKGA